ncbi:MAG TPA: flagellar biosynthesis protein FlhB [Firmicutes bacterium]|nr:flagellar biosynthesis protein FlhB [Bacillota bacterium]
MNRDRPEKGGREQGKITVPVPRRTINLQLFAQEKTEPATPRRREEARRKGQVFKSQELVSALLLVAAFGGLYLFFPYIGGEFKKLVNWAYSLNPDQVATITGLWEILVTVILFFLRLTLPLLALVMVVGLVSNVFQTGFVLSGEPVAFKLERINPVEGLKRILSRRALVQLLKSIAKLVIVLITTYLLLRQFLKPASVLGLMELKEGTRFVGYLTLRLGLNSGAVLLALGIMDFYYQRWEYERSLMMSKQELKDELKQVEGDPQIRSKIRERQRQLASRRMMEDVPRADVVITNPTHYAVALRYDAREMSAPVVLAKGRGYVALRIKEIARDHDIALVENRPLAQGLYWGADIGEEIPPEFYQAVAEVLAFIYRMRNRYNFLGKEG